MTGDYTDFLPIQVGDLDEDHAQMTGDYTPAVFKCRSRYDEDHAQMTGDYTLPDPRLQEMI